MRRVGGIGFVMWGRMRRVDNWEEYLKHVDFFKESVFNKELFFPSVLNQKLFSRFFILSPSYDREHLFPPRRKTAPADVLQ